MRQQRSGFSDVDASADPTALVRFLDERTAQPFFVQNRRRRLDALALRAGHAVLEAGCGVGDFTQQLSAAVGPAGTVVGLDASSVMLQSAHARTSSGGETPRYVLGDAARLPFARATFDACTTERVLFHLDDPAAAAREMVRVARPGARIAVFEPDWGTIVLNAPDRALTEKILALYTGRLASPWAARQLPGIFAAAGLIDITVEASTHIRRARDQGAGSGGIARAVRRGIDEGALTAEEARRWSAGLREIEAAGGYFFSLTFLLVTGRAPHSPSG